MRKALVFYPQNLYPPQAGIHKRGLEILAGLRDIGYEITLTSSNLSAHFPWNKASIESLKKDWVRDVLIYGTSALDKRFLSFLQEYYRRAKKNPQFNSAFYTPPGMRNWFWRRVREISPDLIFMNYAYWDGLIDHRRLKSVRRVIDNIDLITLNRQMWAALEKRLPQPPMSADKIEDQILQENFFKTLGLSAFPQEFRTYDNYDFTVAISQTEADLIKQNTNRTKVVYLPMTHEPVVIQNQYSGNAFFPSGPNPFNIHGYFYFVKRILPKVLAKIPSFALQVAAPWCANVTPVDGILLTDFIPNANLKDSYALARFMICPVFGGTGEQVKIVEAMAYGVPVVALRAAAKSSPIEHGQNGLVADNAEEFSDCVIQLWNDRDLCRRLGNAARETIAGKFSRSRLIEKLASVVD